MPEIIAIPKLYSLILLPILVLDTYLKRINITAAADNTEDAVSILSK